MAKRLRKDLRCRLTPGTKERLKRQPWLRQQALYLGALLPRATTKPVAMKFLPALRDEYVQAVFHGSYGPFWEEKNTEYRGAYLEAAVVIIDQMEASKLTLALIEQGGTNSSNAVDIDLPQQEPLTSLPTENAAVKPPNSANTEPSRVQSLVASESSSEELPVANSSKEPESEDQDSADNSEQATDVGDDEVASEAEESGSIKSMIPQNMFQIG